MVGGSNREMVLPRHSLVEAASREEGFPSCRETDCHLRGDDGNLSGMYLRYMENCTKSLGSPSVRNALDDVSWKDLLPGFRDNDGGILMKGLEYHGFADMSIRGVYPAQEKWVLYRS